MTASSNLTPLRFGNISSAGFVLCFARFGFATISLSAPRNMRGFWFHKAIEFTMPNWPISEMNAVAWFTVMGTYMNELTNLPSGRKAQMTLWKNEREGFSLDDLEAANGDISEYFPIFVFGTRDRHIYRVALHSFNFMTAEGIKPPLVKIIDDVQLVHVDLNFLPHDSQISGGRIILTVNNVTKYFDVPNQNDTNSNLAWQSGFPCWFVATNGVQTSEKQFLYRRN